MATSYDVRVKCDDESSEGSPVYKTENQTTIDPDWVPSGCEAHTLSDFVIEKENA